MIVRPATTEDDFELWTRVRNAVEVDNPTTIEDLRNGLRHRPETRHWLAEDGGAPVACSFTARSSVAGCAFVLPRVVPEARGSGVGSALLSVGLEYARELDCDVARSNVDGSDLAAVRFAANRGFVEVDRQVQLVRPLGKVEPAAVPPPGIELGELRLAPRDDVIALLRVAVEDMPVAGGLGDGLVDEWLEELEGGHFAVVAREDGAVVGLAGLVRCGARDDALEHAMTVVARSHRRRGIAKALKQDCVRWAAASGYRELVTWTQRGNDAMQAVNVAAGFRLGHVSLTVEGAVPS